MIADVKHPILGADFLGNFCLQVDMHNHRLLDPTTQMFFREVISTSHLQDCASETNTI